ncbi:MAG: AAA family ATPase [Rhodospirillales bacterium]|nr:AAA family ATPase [Rhodospirillales bacterium]
MTFSRLRLAGFKSFVEATDVVIEAGTTGIVGPNGCGKSNLVEALRWVMGETSAKRMRGGEMDDVIFGGTASRPSRNVAEVLIELDNSRHTAAPPFDGFDMLEVSRRIDRGSGSTYRVNGKEMRARDVQLLFADAATGARSTALLSQGQVGMLIAAKPKERRILLEEAAGITGLHSRRHEAELRLKAAAANLERVEDVLAALKTQIQSLEKQARQAARFRNVSERIRQTEATLYAVRWRAVAAAVAAAALQKSEAGAAVVDLTAKATAAAARQAEAAAGLPELRRAQVETAAALQRLTLARDTLDAEERRARGDAAACRSSLEQIGADNKHETALLSDAEQALAMLVHDKLRIEARCVGEDQAKSEAQAALAAATDKVTALDARATALTGAVAAAEASRAALARAVADHDRRLQRLAGRAREVDAQQRALAAETADAAQVAEVEAELAHARQRRDQARAGLEAAEQHRAATAERAAVRLADQRKAETAAARLEAEADALAGLLATGASDDARPLLDLLAATPETAAALAAALGDELLATDQETAAERWRTLDALPAAPQLPEGARPLDGGIGVPEALRRRLALIGVVDGDTAGHALQPRLQPGQRLVSRDGAMWRWDGYAVSAAASASTQRLERRVRLQHVKDTLAAAQAELRSAAAAAAEAKIDADAAVAAERQARAVRQAAEAAHDTARDAAAKLQKRLAQSDSRRSALAEAVAAVESERAEAAAARAGAEAEFNALEDPAAARAHLADLREKLNAARTRQTEARTARDAVAREAEGRRRRLETIARETQSWTARQETARKQFEVLRARQKETEQRLHELVGVPEAIARKRAELLTLIEAADRSRREAADALIAAETEQAAADKGLRAAEAALAEARETRVRAEAAAEQAEQARRELAARIVETLQVPPDRLPPVPEGAEASAAATSGTGENGLERQLERLRREREIIGPVNLRAEQEAQELTGRIDMLAAERDDLERAITKLRRGIAELDREGRERLLASFEDVDRHFRQLFGRLFAGGRAHLTLTESDDPLEAGLEIMASPPGKRLQVLSLLSGGEQALATLALVFAVFLTNPAPICVLDEVDAPLDDNNVDRFCTLVDDIARDSGTRFLIITHHRLTMARMDRLYGVTMSEQGVSQLVSVDLRQAEAMRESA